MTNNIVAQFSCSVWKNSEQDRAEQLGFHPGDFKEYPVVNGSVFNEEYSETLDSGTIVLSQVSKKDRLSYIKPYDFVRVYDKSGNTGFDKVFLVDNFDEKENNIEEHVFGYTINLMSETKLLEKIQCPNLTITHTLDKNGRVVKKTIYEYIDQYMRLYVPKIKFCDDGENWEYRYLISWPKRKETNLISDEISRSFDGSDLVDFGHGQNLYILEFDLSIENIVPASELDSVEYAGWRDSSDGEFFNVEITYNSDSGTFHFKGYTHNSDADGVIYIDFTYEEIVVEQTDFFKRFNVPCADLSFNCPTLRQLLTMLMQQVGCIPTVNNRILGYLDFKKDAVTFADQTATKEFNISIESDDFDEISEDHYDLTMVKVLTNTNVIPETVRIVDFKIINSRVNFIAGTERVEFRYDSSHSWFNFYAESTNDGNATVKITYTCSEYNPTVNDYTVRNTVNYIRRSLSSDSFVNNLVNISEQVVDSGNEVICETLGFRDKNNVLLKQKENLKLETSFPIYKVNKCILRHPGKYSGYLSSSVGCLNLYGWGDTSWPEIIYRDNKLVSNSPTLKSCILKFNTLDIDFTNSSYYKVKIDNNLIYFLGRNNNGSYYIITSREFNDVTLNSSNTTLETYSWTYQPAYDTRTRAFSISTLPSEIVGFFFTGVFVNDRDEEKAFSFIKFDESDTNVHYFEFQGNPTGSGRYGTVPIEDSVFAAYYISFAGNRKWDISNLVVEDSARQLLERDFVKMTQEISSKDEATISNLSKYVYGTVGYSIGSKEIFGFSEVFNVGSAAVSWMEKEYTYIENIINVLKYTYDTQETEDLLYDFFGFLDYLDITYGKYPSDEQGGLQFINQMERYLLVNFNFDYYAPTENDFSDKPFFTACIFDIWYQPFNSFNLAYVKSQEDVDYPLQQYDSNASGVADFDRLSTNEQEQVDRVGNETLSINQRTADYSLIRTFENGPLYFKDDTNRDSSIDGDDNGINYIIFKRSFTINNNCFNASYVGSKDAILKDYFTSIRTKYRAYQYVDYNSSFLRKERDTFFIRISTDLYDGDDKIRMGTESSSYNDLRYNNYLIYDLENEEDKSIRYEFERGIAKISNGLNGYSYETQRVKNSISLITTDNMMGLIYEYTDNVGAGAYIKKITNDDDLGGIPQHWQIWSDSHQTNHKVFFVNYIDFYSQSLTSSGDADVIKSQIEKIERSPIVDSSFNYTTVFWLCDDNTNDDSGRSFFKDYSERINHTTQFIYYAPNKDVLISEHFISGTPMIGRQEYPFNAIYGSSDFSINPLPHDLPSGDTLITTDNTISIGADDDNKIPYLRVYFRGYDVIKMCHYDENTNTVIDIAVFKRTSTGPGKDYYFTINDTKTDYVLSEKNGILYRRYKVTTYSHPDTSDRTGNIPVSDMLPRTVVPLYDEEDD